MLQMEMKAEWKPTSTPCLLLQPLAFVTPNPSTAPAASPQHALYYYTIKDVVPVFYDLLVQSIATL